ncbi:type II toxin-antitoxin system ParD family antitoxin [Falsiroseomonas sp. E2-1-a20]|uniref:type II toxin-antitoxin system ParD family antitoxin n=1 Tax=Falsiroseomonas sp. E2-1-a20 TaxID=3239300 RepID=UPI003F39929C
MRKTRNVSLTPQLDAFIDARVATGRYRSSSEVVRAALRLLAEAEALPAERLMPPSTIGAWDSEERFRLVAESTPAMLWMGDRDGTCIYLNRALREFWGVAPDATPGFAWNSVLHPDDASAVYAAVQAGMQDRSGFLVEGRYRHADGGWRILRTEARPRYSPQGEFLGMVGVNADITEARQAETALLQRDARLRDLLATLDLAAILVRDLDGTIRFWSAGCVQIYGWTAEEAVGRRVHDLLGTRLPVPPAEAEAVLLRDGQWRGDLEQHRRDGSSLVVSAQKSVRRDADDQVVAIAESLTDVTLLRRAEAGLRESEERLRLAQEAAGFGIFDWNIQTGAATWSPEMYRLHAIDPDLPRDRLVEAWVERLHRDDRPAAEAAMRQALASQDPLQIEFRVVLPDGTMRWVLARGQVRHDAEGRPSRMVGVNIDVSGLRLAEAKALESEARQRALFDAAPFAVIVIDPDTHAILDVNQRACDDYGYARADFLRLTIADVDAIGDSEAIRARGRARGVGPRAQEFEARHRIASGVVRDVLVRVQGLELGGRRLTYGAHIDITDRKAAEAALRASEARLRLALEAAEFGTWEYDARHDRGIRKGLLSDEFPELSTAGFDLAAWLRPIHVEDRPRVEASLRAVLAGDAPRFEAEFRLGRTEGGWRWISSRGAVVEFDPATGTPVMVAGVARDITESRRAEERQALLAREVDHRAKNALAVVQAALRLTRAPDLPSYIRAIEGRVGALARTQTLLAENRWNGADLRALLQGEIAPFIGGQRVLLDGPLVALAPMTAQALAMAVHELATNAVKHGALSVATGRVAITWSLQGEGARSLRLHWTEAGGPPVPERPPRRGFGSRVLDATLRGQLGGCVELEWRRDGLACTVAVPLAPPGDPGLPG